VAVVATDPRHESEALPELRRLTWRKVIRQQVPAPSDLERRRPEVESGAIRAAVATVVVDDDHSIIGRERRRDVVVAAAPDASAAIGERRQRREAIGLIAGAPDRERGTW